jgi:hypothetical protein
MYSIDKLSMPVTRGIKMLYGDQEYQYYEVRKRLTIVVSLPMYFDFPLQDAMRFRTLLELATHTDAFLARKDFYRKKESLGEKVFRTWYSTANQWCSDKTGRGAGGGMKDGDASGGREGGRSGVDDRSAGSRASTAAGSDEVFIVPADEYFVRCPVSKEVFESVWDEDEGEYMYRNAVKVLVTEKADPAIYALGQPTTGAGDDVHYLIVHKLLVLDVWLSQGRADSLKNTKLRYAQMLDQGANKCELLTQAAEDEDEEDVFVMLELA